jgi:S1-C subfamily serine protease
MEERFMFADWIKAGCVALAFVALPAVAGPPDDAELERRLEEARERLEDASREVAELSAELAEDAVGAVRAFNFDGRRALLGINMDDPRDDRKGVLIAGVTPGGPAEKAGLRSGDLIISLDGTPVADDEGSSPQRTILRLMRDVDPGDEVALEYERAGKREIARVVTEEMGPTSFAFALGDLMEGGDIDIDMDNFPFAHAFNARWGDMEMVTLTSGLGEYFGTDSGILIVRAPKDPEIKLQDGDVIQRIDGRTPSSPGHALRILRSYQGGEKLSLEIVRKQRPMTIDVELSEREPQLRESAAPGRFELRVSPPPVTT